MIHPGLVSITFRKLAPREIISLVQQAQLRSIEWGGDVHVPHGDLARAGEVRALTEKAGLLISAYGSYYRVAQSEADGLQFENVVATAVALGAPTIRVWAGALGSDEADVPYRRRVADETRRIADLAATAGLTISFESHGGTLTDTNTSTRQLLAAINHPQVFAFWQPTVGRDVDYCQAGLEGLLPRLTNLHVYHWWPTPADRQPLVEGTAHWRRYCDVVRSTGRDHFASLEYVRDDNPAAFLEDARTLRALL
jgi:sugar phosphate isomerase/epimerase